MKKKPKMLLGVALTALLFSGTTFAYADNSAANTPNADFNDVCNALVSSGVQQTVSVNGDVLVGDPRDPIAGYSAESGNWVYYFTRN